MSARTLCALAAVTLLLVTTGGASASPSEPRSTVAHPIDPPAPVRPPGMTYGAPGAVTMRQAYAGFKLAPTLPGAQRDKRTATVLTILMTDDTAHQDPEAHGMLRMMDQQTPAGIHSVVFHDGAAVGDSRLYYMRPGDPSLSAIPAANASPIGADGTTPLALAAHESLLAPGVTEVQSNNPHVLSQLVGYTLANYPGRYKYLEIYTHGRGVLGIGTDSRQTDLTGKPLAAAKPRLRVADFARSLRTGLKGRVLDGVYFRSCLMANMEALYELRGSVRYVVASERVSRSTDNSNLTMTKLLQTLAAKGTPPRELARELVVAAHAKNPELPDGSHGGYDTIMAGDLDKIGELKSAINALVLQLKAAMPRERANIVAAYDETGHVRGAMGDLYNFTHQLQARVSDRGVLAAVDDVRAAQRRFMVHERDDMGADNEGLSIFMPPRPGLVKAMTRARYGDTRFARESAWPEFLAMMAAPAPDSL